MTTQQHTRWKVLADHEHQGKSLLHNHRFIAEEGAEWSENGSVEGGSLICAMRDGQHQAAHARLIAAAPELLEALKKCLEALEMDADAIGKAQCSEDIDWFKFGQATVAKQDVAMPAARAALAKATA